MIEIICNGDEDKREKDKQTQSTIIRRPKNIKQIGDVSSDKKLYIEDYAFTYINSIAYNNPEEEQAGVLLGECQKTNDEKCVFIKGVIKAHMQQSKSASGIYFDEKVWNGIYLDIEKYFPDLQVVGWFAAIPHITTERMQRLKKIHLDNFTGNIKTLYLIDTVEKEENFFLYENGELKKQKGYVCFYERNYEMQEYMLEKREKQSTEEGPDKVMKTIRSVIREKEELKQQKKNSTFMYGVSTFMVVVVLVIGINLMNNYEKMQNFDQSIDTLVKQVSNINGDEEIAIDMQATAESELVPVNKLSGNVYPTEDSTEALSKVQQNTSEGSSSTQTAQSQNQTKQEIQTTAAQSQTVSSDCYIYTVKSGDTIMSICKKHYGNASRFSEVIAVNNLEDANKLYVGQEIKLP